jgi:predicted small metal-binding protein
MTQSDAGDELRCDCGYQGKGDTLDARVMDAQRHAHDAHGIDVTPHQVLVNGEGG